MTPHTYAAFNYTIQCDRPLHLPRGQAPGGALEIAAATLPHVEGASGWHLIHEEPDYPGGPILYMWGHEDGRRTFIDYAGWRFAFARGSALIQYEQLAQEPPVEFRHIVERVVLPCAILFTREEMLALHGGAFALGGRAFVCIGPSGVGKSTTALELVRRGARLLSDDMALVDVAAGVALPGVPTLRLWREHLDLAVEAVPLIGAPDKRWFRMREELGAASPAPISQVFILSPTPGAPRRGEVEPVGGLDRLVSLLEQTFDVSAPRTDWARQRLRNARVLAERVPIARCRYERDPEGHPRHVEAILEHIEAL